jgi:hypothetical protein
MEILGFYGLAVFALLRWKEWIGDILRPTYANNEFRVARHHET